MVDSLLKNTTQKEGIFFILEVKKVVDLTKTANLNFKPTLYDVHKVLRENIVGEHRTSLSLFTNWILAEKHVLMAGPRSSGKTFITDNVTELLGEKRVYTMGKGSDKSHWYEVEKMEESDYVVILELNKLTKDSRETLKDWGEGKPSEYKVTTMTKSGKRETESKTLEPKPFVFCLADEDEAKVDVQLRSRLTEIRTDSTVQQNTRVLKEQARLAKLPKEKKKRDKKMKDKLKKHLITQPPLDKYEIIHPASEYFVKAIPKYFTDCRRDFPKYLANTKGITRFHWKNRLIRDGMMFITPQDMFLNQLIYGEILVESSLKCNCVEREILSTLKSGGTPLTSNTIQKEMRKKGWSLSSAMVRKHLNNLDDVGYVHKRSFTGTADTFKLEQSFEDFSFQIDWKKVLKLCEDVVKEHYNDCWDEYSVFVQNPVVVHPFSGKKVNMKDLEVETVKPVDLLTGYVEENVND